MASTSASPVGRRGKDANDGWKSIDPTPRDLSEVPPIPEWVDVLPGSPAESWYYEVSILPQAREWNNGTIMQLWLTLPLINRYIARPGSEGLKAIISALGPALMLTEDDMRKAKVKYDVDKAQVEAAEAQRAMANVSSLEKRRDRRDRLG
jgi:hypothetical protein